MALTQLQSDILRRLAKNRSDTSYLAGGLMLNKNWPRRSDDIDIFHDSDEEVTEVQTAALEVYPDSIVVISGLTQGCECEEGAHCTAQVELALNRDNRTRSLLLSKIDGHWKVGAVQSMR